MRMAPPWIFCLLGLAGCTSLPDGKTVPAETAASTPAPRPQNINWEEVDKSTARSKERQQKSAWAKTESSSVERGYFSMSDEDYAAALASATDEIKKANPKLSDSDVETKARERADDAKRKYENSYTTRASTSVKWTSPP